MPVALQLMLMNDRVRIAGRNLMLIAQPSGSLLYPDKGWALI
jgi:hypothetical protein